MASLSVEEFEKQVQRIIKELTALQKTEDKLKQEIEKARTEWKKIENAVFSLTGLVAAYMAAVKDTDGLVSVMPACLKVLQRAEKAATVETVEAAITQLEAQEGAALKEAGKDADKKKIAASFGKEMDRIAGQLKALL